MRNKLTPRKVLAILSERCVWNCPPMRRHIAQKMSQKFGVSLKTIRDIWCGKTWGHVTGLPPYVGAVDIWRGLAWPAADDDVAREPIDGELFGWTQTEFIDSHMLACLVCQDADYLQTFTFAY